MDFVVLCGTYTKILLQFLALTLLPEDTVVVTSLALRNTLGSMNLSGKDSANVGILSPFVSGLKYSYT